MHNSNLTKLMKNKGNFMKKNLFFIFFFLISVMGFSQNSDFKYYFDENLGFKGYSVAILQGNFKDYEKNNIQDLIKYFDEKMADYSHIQKLTKNNLWLCKKALNEWDIEKDEVYFIKIANSEDAKSMVIIYAIITENKDFIWTAYSLDYFDILKLCFSQFEEVND